MPVFLSLALLSNLTPDDYPQLPPYRVCQERHEFARREFQAAAWEDIHRKIYDPTRMPLQPGSRPPSNDPKTLERWRDEASARLGETMLEASFWHWAVRARSLDVPELQRAAAAQSCRRHLGEALWQKGGWWK
jgi:hypothetical protein